MTAIIGQLLLGWLLADFLSGLFHWLEDQSLWPAVPLAGKLIIGPNFDHHAKPTAFVDGTTFWIRNRFMVATSLIAGTALILALGLHAWIISLMLGGAFVNEAHAWAHRPSMAPKWGKTLQEIGLLQSAKHHALHHRPPQDRNFCILTDWLDPVLELTGFWRRIERLIGAPREEQ